MEPIDHSAPHEARTRKHCRLPESLGHTRLYNESYSVLSVLKCGLNCIVQPYVSMQVIQMTSMSVCIDVFRIQCR